MVKYQHIIWDWNGTLVNDAWLAVEAMNAVLTQYDLPTMTPEFYSNVYDFPLPDYYRSLGFNFDETPYETLSHAFMKGYHNRWRECSLRANTETTLQRFAQMGLHQAVLSAAGTDLLEDMVGYFGIRSYFSHLVGAENNHAYGKLGYGKEWMQQQKLQPEHTLMVGDTLHDYDLAKHLGIDCVLLTSGHQARSRLEECGLPVFDTLGELENWL